MKIRLAAGALAMLTLAACGGQTKPAAETSSAPASSASSTSATSSSATSSETSSISATSSAASVSPASQSPAVAAAKGEKPTKEFVIGKWGTDGDCQMAIELRPDGTSDGPFGNWAYSDGVISFPEDPEFKVNVTIIDDNTMESTNATSDKASKMTRCP